MKNYCLELGNLKEYGIGVCQKMKKKILVVCLYRLRLRFLGWGY